MTAMRSISMPRSEAAFVHHGPRCASASSVTQSGPRVIASICSMPGSRDWHPRRPRAARRYPSGAALSSARQGSALALEDGARDVRLVDDEREHRPIAPPTEEEVAVDVDAGIRESTRQARHPAWSIVDLGHERLAL